MLDIHLFVLLAGLLVFAAHFFEWLFGLTKVPNVLLLMIVGLLLGPVFGLITPDFFGQAGQVGVTIGLIILLFEGGTKLQLGELAKALRGTVSLTLLSFLATMALVGGFVWWFTDLPWLLALMIGAIVGGTEASIVFPLVDQIKMYVGSRTTLLMESALSDVLSVVLAIGLLEAHQSGAFQVGAVTIGLTVAFVGAIGIGVVSGVIWSLLLDRVRHMQNSIFTTPAFVFLVYGLAQLIGFEGLIAALFFGITLGNMHLITQQLHNHSTLLQYIFRPVSLSRRERVFFSEIVFLLETAFFVFVGLSITFVNAWLVFFGLLLTLAMLIVRLPVVQLTVPKKTPVFDASLMAVLIPKGLAAAVLAAIPLQRGVVQGQLIQDLVYLIILFSVVLTSLAIFLLQRTEAGAWHRRLLAGFGYYLEPPKEAAAPPVVPPPVST